jgi:hypothetical protein
MVPLKSLLASVLPLPSKALFELAAGRAACEGLGRMPGSALMLASRVPVLSTLLLALWLALIFSSILITMMSPTWRARWSSNSGR